MPTDKPTGENQQTRNPNANTPERDRNRQPKYDRPNDDAPRNSKSTTGDNPGRDFFAMDDDEARVDPGKARQNTGRNSSQESTRNAGAGNTDRQTTGNAGDRNGQS